MHDFSSINVFDFLLSHALFVMGNKNNVTELKALRRLEGKLLVLTNFN